jgi:protein phosphatase PTC7
MILYTYFKVSPKLIEKARSRAKFIGIPIVSLAIFGIYRTYTLSTTTSSSTIDLGVACIPKDISIPALFGSKIAPCDCGEDSFAIATGKGGKILMSVADGVGSWRKKGVNPALFSRALCSYLSAFFTKNEDQAEDKNLLQIVQRSFNQLITDVRSSQNHKVKPFGSSTICAAIIDSQSSSMDVLNIGDSGLRVVRNGKFIYKTETQQYRFNAPFQLYLSPEGIIRDPTDKALTSKVDLWPKDLVVLATDGVFDNISEPELLETLTGYSNRPAQQVAEILAAQAWRNSHDPKIESPFSKEAKRHGKEHNGGKSDDITVIVAIIQ